MELIFGLIGFFVILGLAVAIPVNIKEKEKTEKIQSEIFESYYKH